MSMTRPEECRIYTKLCHYVASLRPLPPSLNGSLTFGRTLAPGMLTQRPHGEQADMHHYTFLIPLPHTALHSGVSRKLPLA